MSSLDRVFVASVLPFSKENLSCIDKVIRDFLWENEWHVANRELISTLKEQGGLGIISIAKKVQRLIRSGFTDYNPSSHGLSSRDFGSLKMVVHE